MINRFFHITLDYLKWSFGAMVGTGILFALISLGNKYVSVFTFLGVGITLWAAVSTWRLHELSRNPLIIKRDRQFEDSEAWIGLKLEHPLSHSEHAWSLRDFVSTPWKANRKENQLDKYLTYEFSDGSCIAIKRLGRIIKQGEPAFSLVLDVFGASGPVEASLTFEDLCRVLQMIVAASRSEKS